MERSLQYNVQVTWTGNRGNHTSAYDAYDRNHTIAIVGKPDILASSDAPFRGDVSRHNPEDMLVSALSTCHMLWYLHLCADAGILVASYTDSANGTLTLTAGAPGRFTEVVLHPVVTVTDATMAEKARELHNAAHEKCFIANSVNFTVRCEPVIHIVD
ncbi:MAG: OsmC family peroxiredoxin [Chitinophagia bacterium]|nr:OsmC family peroxiredoxin [Chitinophagia bacterium]